MHYTPPVPFQEAEDGTVSVTELSCVLDAADEGGLTFQQVADVLGCTRQRVEQLEQEAFAKLARKAMVKALKPDAV